MRRMIKPLKQPRTDTEIRHEHGYRSLSPRVQKPVDGFLVAQWLRIRLPVQGTQVRALAREDPTCRGATKPVRHNY